MLSNALLMAQKKNGQAAEINEVTLKHFPSTATPGPSTRKRSVSPSKNLSSGGSSKEKDKGKASAKNSDEEEEDEDSGDEAEKLDEEQLNEIDTIYRK